MAHMKKTNAMLSMMMYMCRMCMRCCVCFDGLSA